jgi:hypothetical protein
MKERGNTTKSLLIAIAILGAVGFGAYAYINRGAPETTDLIVVDTSNATGVDGDLLQALQQLRVIKLDTSIFGEPLFRSFLDFGTEIAPQPRGRQNPFAPVGSTSIAPASQTSSSTQSDFSLFQ